MLILAILAMMNANNAPAAPPPGEAVAPAPSAKVQMCKDVLGRTVKCNPG